LNIPAISVKACNLGECIDILKEILPPELSLMYGLHPHMNSETVRENGGQDKRSSGYMSVDGEMYAKIYIAEGYSSSRSSSIIYRQSSTPGTTFAVFHLPDLPPGLNADAVVGAFKEAWKFSGKVVIADVKYHQDTHTLLVNGAQEEIAIAERVVGILRDGHSMQKGVLESISDTLKQFQRTTESQLRRM
jgi:hypothetical protein